MIRWHHGELFQSMNVARRCLLALSCLTTLTLSPTAAVAASPAPLPSWDRTVFRPTGGVTTTRVSGRAGVVELATTPQADFLVRFRGRERNDDPCQNQAEFFHERALSPRVTTRIPQWKTDWTNRCGRGLSASQNSEREALPAGGAFRQQDGTLRVIAGVRVCMNRKRTRVKGIRVYGASINSAGGVSRDSLYNGEYRRSRCSSWESARMCPNGQVATAAQFNYDRTSLVGIALQCQAVTTVQLATRD